MGKKITNIEISKKRNVTPAFAIKEFKKHGIIVDEKQAETMLDFLYLLAGLAVNRYLNEDD